MLSLCMGRVYALGQHMRSVWDHGSASIRSCSHLMFKLLLPNPLSEKVGGHLDLLMIRDMLYVDYTWTSPERTRCLRTP